MNIEPKAPSAKEKTTSTSKPKAVEKKAEEEKEEQVYTPMNYRKRVLILKDKSYWEKSWTGRLHWDTDLEALALDTKMLETHQIVPGVGIVKEVSDPCLMEDDAAVISKVKAARGWFGDL